MMSVHKCQGHPSPQNVKVMPEAFGGNEMCAFVIGLKGAGLSPEEEGVGWQQNAFPNALSDGNRAKNCMVHTRMAAARETRHIVAVLLSTAS